MTLNEALYILLIVCELILLAWMSFYILSLIFSWFKGAPYVATRTQEIQTIVQKLKLTPGQQFLELGCGDGRVTLHAIKHYKVRGRGVDINPLLIGKAQCLAHLRGLKEVTFHRGDIRNEDFSQADVIYIYLFPKLVQSLKQKLLAETKPGARIVSHGFKISYLLPYQQDILQGYKFHTYIYQMPFDKAASQQL